MYLVYVFNTYTFFSKCTNKFPMTTHNVAFMQKLGSTKSVRKNFHYHICNNIFYVLLWHVASIPITSNINMNSYSFDIYYWIMDITSVLMFRIFNWHQLWISIYQLLLVNLIGKFSVRETVHGCFANLFPM